MSSHGFKWPGYGSMIASGPLCATCKQEVDGVPMSAAKDFKVYCSERCRPSAPDDLLQVAGRFDSMGLRNR
jgi:hypothetical protein